MISNKVTTGLTGLIVQKHPHLVLEVLYNKITKCLVKMPEDSAYRKHTEEMILQRSAILKSEQDPEKVEVLIGAGQIEEVIVQAKSELNLARNMLVWKPWEPLIAEAPKEQWTWPLKHLK